MSIQRKDVESILRETGIEFEETEDKEKFCSILEDEIDVRIGSKIEKELPDEMILQLDNCQTEEDEKEYFEKYEKWVMENSLTVIRISSTEIEKIKNELKQYKDRILGLKK